LVYKRGEILRGARDDLSPTRKGWVAVWRQQDNVTPSSQIRIATFDETDTVANKSTVDTNNPGVATSYANPLTIVRTDGTADLLHERTLTGTGQIDLALWLNAGNLGSDPPTEQAYHWHYEYDDLGRLTTACSDWDAAAVPPACKPSGHSFNYEHDGAGNLTRFDKWNATAVQTVRYATWSKSNRIQCIDADNSGGCSGTGAESIWLYDAYGNLILDPSRAGEATPIVGRYVYDAANRLTEVCLDWSSSTSYSTGTCQGIITTYQYNGDGDRVSQTVGGVTTNYVIDPASSLTNVLSETTSGVTTQYLYGLELVGQKSGATTSYFEYDGLGSVRQLTDGTGAIQLTQTFDPYGNGYSKSGTAASSFGYTGEQTDGNGFVYLRARYYQPGMGRFFGVDPSRQETNPYQYVMGNPVNRVDPSGKCASPFTGISAYIQHFWGIFGGEAPSGYYAANAMIEECQQNIALSQAPSTPGLRPFSTAWKAEYDQSLCQVTVCPILRDVLLNTQQDFTAPNRAFTGGWGYLSTDPLNYGLDLLSTADVTTDIMTLGVGALSIEDAIIPALRRALRDSVDAEDVVSVAGHTLDVPSLATLSRRAGSSIPDTGVPFFDRRAIDTPEFLRWKANLEAKGYTFIERSGGNPAEILPTKVILYDPNNFMYVDLLHESRHIGQLKWGQAYLDQADLRITDVWSADLIPLLERGAYEYEMRLGAKYGFSDEYMLFLTRELYDPKIGIWDFNVNRDFEYSPTLQRIFEEMFR